MPASHSFFASVEITSECARWTILGNNGSLTGLLQALGREGIRFEVKLKRNIKESAFWTARQEQIL